MGCPEELQMVLIDQMAEPLLAEPSQGPYVVCALQECRRMNVLLGVITKSLSDLEKGLAGTLNMTQAIEDLIAALTISEWLSGLFNPMAYLTSILQVTARATGSALDAMTQETHMTVYKDAGAIPPDSTFPENGAFIHGLFIEGARWPFGDEVEEPYEFGGAKVGGFLLESRLKELMPPVPVVYVKAVLVHRPGSRRPLDI